MLKERIHEYETVSIIGIAKNAGKTTVLNQIIEEYKGKSIGITSIGLDGEQIDNITSKPKPRIKVYPKMIVATANDCLGEFTSNYVIHEMTNVKTQLGNIMIVEIITEGYALVAGPSTNHEMIELKSRMLRYKIKKLLIDGALYRKSIISFRVADACILATGASFDDDINNVIGETKKTVDQLHVMEARPQHKIKIIKYNKNLTLSHLGRIEFIDDNLVGNEEILLSYLKPSTRVLYLKGALTNKIVNQIVTKWSDIETLTIIVDDPSHILLNKASVKRLDLMKIKVKVMNTTKLIVVTCNPVSPNGTTFDNEKFKDRLSSTLHVEVVNVLDNKE